MAASDEVDPLKNALDAIGRLVGQKSQKQQQQTATKADSDEVPDERPAADDEEKPETEEQEPEAPRGDSDSSDDDDGTPIPQHRFNKVNERLKAQKAENEKLQKELASLRSKQNGAAKAAKPKAEVETEDDVLAPFARAAAAKEMFASAGHELDTKQALFSLDVLETTGLKPDEAVLVAQQRQPELFGGKGGKKPPSHHVQDPQRGGHQTPPRDDRGRFRQKILEASHSEAKAMLVERLGMLTGRR